MVNFSALLIEVNAAVPEVSFKADHPFLFFIMAGTQQLFVGNFC